MTISCARCYYAEDRYSEHGEIIGIDCMKDNARFIPADIASCQHCGCFAERDD